MTYPPGTSPNEHLANLEKRVRELTEALEAIVSLDDGDNPGLWAHQAVFDHARAALAKAGALERTK